MADIYTTADIVKALAQEREKKLPQRSSFFSGIVPQVSAQDAAMNRPEPVERASLFPLATYPDGSTRLALPGMIAEDIPRAFTAPARAYRGEIADEDMIAEGLNFGGTMAMGGSVVPKGASAVARVAANATESAAPGVIVSEAGKMPQTFRGYSGMGSVPDTFTRGPWASDSPITANSYTTDGPASYLAKQPVTKEYSAVMPLEFKFDNPMIVDAKGSRYNGIEIPGQELSNSNRLYYQAEDLGHDGLVIRNVRDDVEGAGQPATTYAAIKPGTTYSAITGDLLFENGANAAAPGVIVSEAARAPRQVQMEVPFFRGSGHAQTSVDYSKPYWGTTDRSTADFYARSMAQAEGATPNVTPAVARFRNPMLVDAQGAGFSEIPFDGKRWSTDDLAAAAKERGHDGLVIDRLYDGGRWNPDEGLPATVAALGPGTVSSAFDPNTILYANSRSSSAPGVLAAEAADKPRGIRAYHGSPHDFDRFDLSKIGTGEGAQAYGHGLYFAENEGVAKSYRDGLSSAKSMPSISDAMNAALAAAPEIANRAKYDGVSSLIAPFANYPDPAKALREAATKASDPVLAKAYEGAAAALEAKGPGRMYEVNINADPADFLDWDKPLSQQSEKVQQALKYARRYLIEDGTGTGGGWTPWKSAGASEKLREAGIPGIRYLDQGSRGAGDGSRNLVVFDDALIEILRKYMNPPTAAAPGVLMYEGAKDARQ